MEINKAAQAASSGAPTAVQLEAINNLAKAHLTAQQVYVFSLRLCDDQVDRDFERFDSAALPDLPSCLSARRGSLTTSGAATSRWRVSSRPRWCGRTARNSSKHGRTSGGGMPTTRSSPTLRRESKRRYPWGAPWGAPYAPSAGATTVPAGIGRARAMTDRSAAPFYRSRWTPTSFPLWPSRHSGRPGC